MLPAASRRVLNGWLSLHDDVRLLMDDVEQWMAENLEQDHIVAILQTIPGIGLILAHVIRAEVGELDGRFANRRKFTSYCGLAPLADDSADRHGPRHISPACSHTLRWAYIEAAAQPSTRNTVPPTADPAPPADLRRPHPQARGPRGSRP